LPAPKISLETTSGSDLSNIQNHFIFFYRPFASLSRDTEIAETQAAVSWLCVLCASSEAGGKYIQDKKSIVLFNGL